MQLQFFNPYAEIRHTENRLPHWQQNGGVYFITFRLADALPMKLRKDWQHERDEWLKIHPEPWSDTIELEFQRQFSGKLEQWLDAGYGSCVLRQPGCAAIINEGLHYFDGDRIRLVSSVVMPNHAHVLFVQNPEYSLEKLLRTWKSYTSRQINALLHRSGGLWEKDYFDRLIRDEHHFANCVRYIRKNPAKAKLKPGEYILYESDISRRIE